MKRLLGLLPLLLVLLLGVLLALPMTERGSRGLVALVDSYTPLEIDYAGGRLLGTFALRSLRLESAELLLALDDVEASLNVACLVQGQLCFERLQVARLQIEVPESEADESAGKAADAIDTTPLVFPLRVLAPEVQIASTRVQWDGGSWAQQSALLAVVVETTGVYVTGGRIVEPRITVESGSDKSPERIELPALSLPFELALDRLELVQPSWNLAGQEGNLERITLRGRWQWDRLQIAQATASRSDWGQLELQGDLRFTDDWPLDARVSVVPSSGLPGMAELQTGPLVLQAGGNLGALKLDLRSTGVRRLQLRGTLDTLASELGFDAEAQLDWDGDWPLANLVELPPEFPPVTLHPPLSVSASGDLEHLSLLAGGSASGAGYQQLTVLLEGQWREGQVQVDSFSAREQGEEGSAIFAEGRLLLGDQPEVVLSLTTPGLTLPDTSEYVFGRIEGALALSARFPADGWTVDLKQLELAGEVNGLPATASGNLQLDSVTYLAGGKLDFSINGARGTLGRGAVAGESLVKLSVADLGRWQRSSRGAVDLQARLQPARQTGSFTIELDELAWQDLSLERGEASGEFSLQNGGAVQADIDLRGLKQGELILYRSEVALSGRGAEYQLDWQSKGDIEGRLALTARRDRALWRGTIGATEIATPLGSWALARDVGVLWKDRELTLDPHCWRNQQTELCLERARLGEAGELDLSLQGDAALLAQFATEGVQVDGDLQGALHVDWTATRAPRGRAQLFLDNGFLSQQFEDRTASWSWDRLQLEADLQEEQTVLKGLLERDQRSVLSLQAQVTPGQGNALSGRLQVEQLQLAALLPFAPMLARLEGGLEGELTLSGTVEAPQAQGKIHWREGALQLQENPTTLEAVDLAFDLRGEHILIDGRGLLGGGELTLKGVARSLPDWSLELDVTGQGNRLSYPPSVEVVVSQQLKVTARAELVSLNGSIAVDEGRLEQDQLPEGSVELSPDVVRVDYAGKVLEDQRPFDTSINLRLAIAERFRVLGSGVDATVGGDLEVRQRPGSPLQLYGNLNVVGGEFRAYGQHLSIKQGRVSFAGVPENPELDLRAEREISLEQVTAGVRVSGTLDAPNLQVYTDPVMTQAESLSYLVRGRGLDSGADADGTALALSLGTGIINRSALVEGLNSLPGLNHVEFGAEGGADDAAATVSGYIGDRIYLSYGVGLYEPVNVLTARLYLYTRLWLEVVSRLESSLDLYYSFDID